VIVRSTWGAAAYTSLPAWLASTTHVPLARYVTVLPDTWQIPGVPELNTTGLPEAPPVADSNAEVRVAPFDGAKKEIAWGFCWTVIVRRTGGASA
jgi:hypothetical protein